MPEQNGNRIRRTQIIRGWFIGGAFVTILSVSLSFLWLDRTWDSEDRIVVTSVLSGLLGLLASAGMFLFRKEDED